MAKNPDSPDITHSVPVDLPDGRRVRVISYTDGSIRFRVDGMPYVLTEAYLSGGANDHAIIKISPGKQGSNAHSNWFRDQTAKSAESE